MSFWKRLFGSKDKPSSPNAKENKTTSSKGVEPSSSVTDNASPMQFQIDRREVRVFISSTFSDMMLEREVLVKKVFPQLRKLCTERFVTFSEVDLRWGITEKQKDEGQVLPLILAEIERCKPFFIGILGERYGWVPDENAFTQELLSDQPWLTEHKEGASVTELEIIHGVLGSHAMQDRAFFYFRDHAYKNNIPEKERIVFIEVPSEEEIQKYGKDEAERRAEERRTRLESLKTKISQSGHHVFENYPDPNTFGQMVLDHLTKAIETLYPETATPSDISREAAAQESYAIGKRLAYVKRPNHTAVLDRCADEDPQGKGIVLFGESGCGKTALLADWTEKRRGQHPEEFIIQHYLGATPESASAMGCVRRLLGELKERYNLSEEIPSGPDKLREALPLWLAQTAGKGKIIIVLDGLNQIEGEERDRRLEWLPSFVPSHVRIITSALPGPALEELRKRQWQEHEIPLAGAPEREEMIRTFLHIYRKALTEDLFKQLAVAPGAANPLYLRTVLEELRIFGSHEELPAYLTSLIKAKTPAELFRFVIQRWIKDYSPKRALAAKALKLLWAARQGLSEHEWMELIESEGSGLLRIEWTPLLLAMEPHLNQRVGLYTFGHAYFREAVETELVPIEGDRRQAHMMIADYFEEQPVGSRKAVELPWQLREVGERARLTKCLLDIPLFILIRQRDQNELMSYWVWLGQGRTMGQLYLQAFDQWVIDKGDSVNVSFTAIELGLFLSNAALYTEAEPLYKRALQLKIKGKFLGAFRPEAVSSLNNLAVLYHAQGKYAEAERLHKRALEISETVLGKDHPEVATSLNNLAVLYQDQGKYAEAEPLHKRALEIREKVLGKDHPEVALSLNSLAVLYQDQGKYAEAERLHKRALEIGEKVLGADHPNVAAYLNNLAALYDDQGRYAEAEPLYKRALKIKEKVLGSEHPDVAISLNNMAELYRAQGKYTEAEPLHKRALTILEKGLGAEHPDVAISLNNMGRLYSAMGRYAEAEPLYKRALKIREKVLGSEHRDVATSLNNLAELYRDQGKNAEALALFERALTILQRF